MEPAVLELVRGLSTNAGLMAFLAVTFGLVTLRSQSSDAQIRASRNAFMAALGGILFGGFGIASVAMPIQLADGVYLDVKTVVLVLAVAYLAPWPAACAVAMVVGYRWSLGGAALWPAMAEVTMAVGWAAAMRSQRQRFDHWLGRAWGSWLWLLLLGLVAALVGLMGHALLPAGLRAALLPALVLPLALVYPLAVVGAGSLMEATLALRQREQESLRLQTQLRESLQESRQLASIFQNSRDTIAILSPTGTLLDVNPTYCKVTGYTREELVGQPWSRLKGNTADRFPSVAREIAQSGRWQGEVARKRKNGDIFLSEITIDALVDEDGVVRRWVSIGRDLTEKRRMEEEVRKAGNFDPLSGLPNRRMVTEELRGLLKPGAPLLQTPFLQRSLRSARRQLAVAVLDIDDFRKLNDRLGYQCCDTLLRDVAIRLRQAVGAGSILGRLGGDEFVVVLADFQDLEQALDRIRQIKQALSGPWALQGETLHLNASVGVTFSPDDSSDEDGLLRHADLAMYAAKEAGKNQIFVFDTQKDLKAQARRETIKRIDQAIDAGEMELFFQPKLRIHDRKIVGAEALVRWRHPERGLIAPGGFLDEIAGTPTAAKLDHWVLHQAVSTGRQWQEAGTLMPVSVNMTVSTLIEPNFLKAVHQLLRQNPELPFNFLEVELLETETLNDLSMVAFVMQELMDAGVMCSIDDFGTGYSSLAYLQRLPAQIIKVDQSFVRDILDDQRDCTLVKGIISLAKAFDRVVVAEGVETLQHAHALQAMGCDVLQGYGIARPMPSAQLPGWVEDWDAQHNVPASAPSAEPVLTPTA